MIGKSQPIGSRWAQRWNKGDSTSSPRTSGKPPTFGEDQRDQLLSSCERDQPWMSREIHYLLHENSTSSTIPSTSKFLKKARSHAQFPAQSIFLAPKTPKRSSKKAFLTRSTKTRMSRTTNTAVMMRRAGPSMTISARTAELFSSFDTSHLQPWDNSQRLYHVDDPQITRHWFVVMNQWSASTLSMVRA